VVLSTFTPIPLGSAANGSYATIDPAFPTGNVTLGGVPFVIPAKGKNVVWNNYPNGPKTGTIVTDFPVDVAGATQVHTLINTAYGQSGPNSYLGLEFFGSAGAEYTLHLVGNFNIRDFNDWVWTNSINGTSTVNVFNNPAHTHRIDMQTITLPAAFAGQTLTDIKMVDSGGFLFQRAILYGITVTASPTLNWNDPEGGVDLTDNAPLSASVPVAFYWSPTSTYDAGTAALAADETLAAGQGPLLLHVTPEDLTHLGPPPEGTKYLLAVIDPNHTVLPPGAANVMSVAYNPTITVTGTYDGSSNPAVIGRFLEVPGLVSEQVIAKLSPSLAALRPAVGTFINQGEYLEGHPYGPLLNWDGLTYITDAFDPGSLTKSATLTTEAQADDVGKTSLAEVNTTLDVQALPAWMVALQAKPTFERVGNTPDGIYTVSGFLTNFAYSSGPLTIPGRVPFVGGKTASVNGGLYVTVDVHLKNTVAPTVSGNVEIKGSILGQDVTEALNPTEVSAHPNVRLDPETLAPNGDLGITFTIDHSQPIASYTLYSSTYPIDVPLGVAEFSVKGRTSLTVKDSIDVTLSDNKTFAISPAQSTFSLVVDTTITGGASFGYFVPASFEQYIRNLFHYSGPIDFLTVSASISGSLDFNVNTIYNGTVPETTYAGGALDITPSPTLSLIFLGKTVASTGKLPIKLFPPGVFPYKFVFPK
jgi:hypothetical protein